MSTAWRGTAFVVRTQRTRRRQPIPTGEFRAFVGEDSTQIQRNDTEHVHSQILAAACAHQISHTNSAQAMQ